jgi:hypothetical protein
MGCSLRVGHEVLCSHMAGIAGLGIASSTFFFQIDGEGAAADHQADKADPEITSQSIGQNENTIADHDETDGVYGKQEEIDARPTHSEPSRDTTY